MTKITNEIIENATRNQLVKIFNHHSTRYDDTEFILKILENKNCDDELIATILEMCENNIIINKIFCETKVFDDETIQLFINQIHNLDNDNTMLLYKQIILSENTKYNLTLNQTINKVKKVKSLTDFYTIKSSYLYAKEVIVELTNAFTFDDADLLQILEDLGNNYQLQLTIIDSCKTQDWSYILSECFNFRNNLNSLVIKAIVEKAKKALKAEILK